MTSSSLDFVPPPYSSSENMPDRIAEDVRRALADGADGYGWLSYGGDDSDPGTCGQRVTEHCGRKHLARIPMMSPRSDIVCFWAWDVMIFDDGAWVSGPVRELSAPVVSGGGHSEV